MLPDETAVSVEMTPLGKANLVALSLVSRAPRQGRQAAHVAGRSVRIEARLAADHRFEKPEEAK